MKNYNTISYFKNLNQEENSYKIKYSVQLLQHIFSYKLERLLPKYSNASKISIINLLVSVIS